MKLASVISSTGRAGERESVSRLIDEETLAPGVGICALLRDSSVGGACECVAERERHDIIVDL